MLHDLWVAFGAGAALGLATIPHCAAMCGPLAAASCRAEGSALPRAAQYQLGRLAAYLVLGAVAGAVGAVVEVALPTRIASIALSISVAAGLSLTAYRLLRGTENSGNGLVSIGSAKKPAPIASRLTRVLSAVIDRPLLLGLATAMLPCGALAAAVLVAAGTGGVLAGTSAMLGFALVSSPGLVALSLAAGKLGRLGKNGTRALAVVLAIGAVVAIARPIPLLLGDDEPACCHRHG